MVAFVCLYTASIYYFGIDGGVVMDWKEVGVVSEDLCVDWVTWMCVDLWYLLLVKVAEW